MRQAAKVVGIVWMVACAALWVWVGMIWQYEPDLGNWLPWTLPRLLEESKFGLTMVPILLGGMGYALYRWGTNTPPASR